MMCFFFFFFHTNYLPNTAIKYKTQCYAHTTNIKQVIIISCNTQSVQINSIFYISNQLIEFNKEYGITIDVCILFNKRTSLKFEVKNMK